jgi:hypothetical protein
MLSSFLHHTYSLSILSPLSSLRSINSLQVLADPGLKKIGIMARVGDGSFGENKISMINHIKNQKIKKINS